MLKFTVPDMTCGHCASAIRNAIAEIDNKATVDIDLENKVVNVKSDEGAEQIRGAIENAGYAVRGG